ncbi:LacI family DNA-binding transcriptional regulator [Clostridium gasigenes]|uniref:LacI family DNA-binding transcriptional regulator n=1 Tax=Clostridium gasigenes TaxID=94869 RepID=UPI00143863BC|nr:LacI family DNA-binding transcriptional regulator [Clostridium gasigenes]NKF05742.1 LacI family transcriptional regulator [Clostridium gasigenes]QSW19523.1 LacI family DNA-binding transcriptional regulator [Clostridium gasigenes]
MNMKDIAKLAGVSKATVSRVINNSQNVSSELKEKVEKILKETGYTPNLLAQELVTKRTKVIGVIIPRIGIDTFSNITEGIIDKLNEYGYNVLLANSREKIDEELKYFDIFKKKHVDGIIFFPTSITEEHIRLLDEINTPIVMMGQENSKIDASCVIYDDFNAAKEIVSYLINQGHEKIAYIGLEENKSVVASLRKNGYLYVLKENKIDIKEEYISSGNFDVSSGYNAMKNIINNSKETPTAIFAAIDRLAFGALKYLREFSYEVPNQISVVGIDDMDMSSVFEPTLTTIQYDYYDSGKNAASLILEKINNDKMKNRSIVMGYNLIIRNSTKKNKI